MTLELVMMFAIALGSIGFAKLLRIESIWFAFSAGLVGVLTLRSLTFLAMYPLGLGSVSKWVFVAGCLLIFGLGIFFQRDNLLRYSLLPIAIALFSIFTTRIVGLSYTGQTDSRWILVVVRQLQQNGDLGIFNDLNALKRGFIYPLTLALGESQEFLTSFTPYAFAALCSTGVAIAQILLRGYSRSTILLSTVGIVVALFTTSMWLRATVYVNSHVAAGLLLAVVAMVSLRAIEKKRLETNDYLLLLCTLFLLGQVRAEGVVVGLIALLPLASQQFISRKQLITFLITPATSFAVWLVVYNNLGFHATKLPAVLFILLLAAIAVIPAIKWFDWLRFRSVTIVAGGSLLALLAITALYPPSMLKGWNALFENLVLSMGRWGFVFVLIAVLLLISISKSYSAGHKLLMKILILLVPIFMLSKTLDDVGGARGLGRTGWGDSLNRMWIHIMVLLAVTAAVAVANKLQPEIVKGKSNEKD